MLTIGLLFIFSYLFGSIPVGVLIGRACGFDPRAVGSGNIGMTNVARAGGKLAAALTFAGDTLKGLIPVLVARLAGFTPEVIAIAGLLAFIGAVCSVFLRFKGGKGVSASLGVWLGLPGLAPIPVLIALSVFVAVFAATRVVSMASICAAITLPPAAAILALPRPYVGLAIVMTGLVLLRHRENIARLIQGQEPTMERKSGGRGS